MTNHYEIEGAESVEAIDVIEGVIQREALYDTLNTAQGWCVGNALKYLLRLGKKDDVMTELYKAENYIHRARTGEWLGGEA